MQVPLHRVHRGRSIGLGLRVALRDRHRMGQADAQCQPLQGAILGLRAGLLDVGVYLHCLAILATGGAVGDDHLLHQISIRQQLLEQRLLRFPLLGEFRQAARRGLGQDDVFHQFRVQFVARQELRQVRQHGLGRRLGLRRHRREGLLGGSVRLCRRRLVLTPDLSLHRPQSGRRRRRLALIRFQEGGLPLLVNLRQRLLNLSLQGLELPRVACEQLLPGSVQCHFRHRRFPGRPYARCPDRHGDQRHTDTCHRLRSHCFVSFPLVTLSGISWLTSRRRPCRSRRSSCSGSPGRTGRRPWPTIDHGLRCT